ncbi:MAG: tetratricopeptide repeat protein [Sphingomonas sp.]
MRIVVLLVSLVLGAAAAAAFAPGGSMPDLAAQYYQRANCHQAYDAFVDALKNGDTQSDADAAWARRYEDAAEKGAKCPAPTEGLAKRAANRIVSNGEALQKLVPFMNADDPAAYFEAGQAVLNGKVDFPKEQGVAMIKKSSDLGYPPGQFLIASGYISGAFGAKDYATALPLVEAAAAQGHVDAQFMAANFYKDGIANKKDPKKALDYYRQAAEQGHPYAAIMAFYMVQDGAGVPKDLNLAYRLARNLAGQGEAIGAVLSASALLQQKNAKDNEDEVLYWMDIAIRDGDAAIREQVSKMRPRVVAAFDRANAPPEYHPPVHKACPMKTVCFVDHYSGLQECHTNKDYWNDCDS